MKAYCEQFFTYMLTVENFLFKKFKIIPFELEKYCTIFDFNIFVERLIADIEKENKELNENGKNSQLVKSLRYTRNILNTLNLGT